MRRLFSSRVSAKRLAIVVLLMAIAVAQFAPSSAAWYAVYLPLIADKWPGAPAYFSQILITEVLYAGVDTDPDLEWIEIYTRGLTPLSLEGYKVGDGESEGDREGMYHFPRNTVLEPGRVVIIANRATDFFATYGFSPDFELFDTDQSVPDLRKYKGWAIGNLNLSNTGDEVLLLNGDNLVIDAVSWGDSKFAFDPSVPGVPQGSSLERTPADQDRDRASDWRGQPHPSPGVVDLRPPTPTQTMQPTPTQEPCSPASVLITEVLYDPLDSLEPEAEWFEIYNPGLSGMWLSCLRIGDEEVVGGGEGMYQFPQGFLFEPGQVVVIAYRADLFADVFGQLPDFEVENSRADVPDLIKDRSWASGSLNLSNAGDDLLILDNTDELIDAVSWGNSDFAFSPSVRVVAEGHSVARYPANVDTDSAGDWIEQSNPDPGTVDINPPQPTDTVTPTPSPTLTKTPTLTATSEPCESIKLLITEVYFDPPGSGDPDGEWFEIFNADTKQANLSCNKIGDEETKGGGEGMYIFPVGSHLASGGVLVVANRGTTFYQIYGFKPDFELIASDAEVPDLQKYFEWAGGTVDLSNAGDDVILLDGEDNLVDAVSWGDSHFAFSPSAPIVDPGHSLERKPANWDSDTAQDWIDQVNPHPGEIDLQPPTSTPSPTSTPTPGQTPSATPTRTAVPQSSFVINEIHADPHVSLGDANADGTPDTLEDEFVEIVNVTSGPIDLGGWIIRDAAGIRHVFSMSSWVQPGCSAVVFGGGDPQGAFGDSLVQIASTGNLGLNDRGDIISLYDSSGELIATYTYGIEADDSQSVTRDPDVLGPEPLIKHSLADGANGALFSPGTRVDGGWFTGCIP